MREIKFRMWDETYKRMIYSPEFSALFSIRFRINDMFSESKDIWLQYTGLKDKNGKEIYEGDVLRWFPFSFATEPETIIVELPEFFEEKGYQEREMGREYLSERLEILGNIYENPELVE